MPISRHRTVLVFADAAHGRSIRFVADRLREDGATVVDGGSVEAGSVALEEFAAPEALAEAGIILSTPRFRVTGRTLAAAPRLDSVCVPVVGTDAIDVAAMSAAGVLVGYSPTEETTVGMAEGTVALLLSLFYRLDAAQRALRAEAPRPAPARQLMAKTVGLVGYGRIARAVAARLAGFGVRLLAAHSGRASSAQDGPARIVDLDTLLRESDAVLVLAALTEENRHLIDARRLALMKPTAYLVNTARGALVDEAALVAALEQGRLAGAALDVFEREPLATDHPLRRLDNVVLTPHVAGVTAEAIASRRDALLENARRLLRGEPALHCRNPEALALWRRRIADGTD